MTIPHIVTFDPGTYEGWTTQVDKNLEHQTGSNEATQHFIRCHQRYLSRVGVGKASAMYGLTQKDIRRGTKKPNNATFHWYPTFWSLEKHNFHDRLVLPERGFPVYNIYGAKSSMQYQLVQTFRLVGGFGDSHLMGDLRILINGKQSYHWNRNFPMMMNRLAKIIQIYPPWN